MQHIIPLNHRKNGFVRYVAKSSRQTGRRSIVVKNALVKLIRLGEKLEVVISLR